MPCSYNKLWKTLIDNGLSKTEFRKSVGISSATLAKMGKELPVSTAILISICDYFKCDFSDIVEYYHKPRRK